MISDLYVTIVLPNQGTATMVGRLHIDQQGRDVHASFVYGRRYCQNPDAIELDPLRLPLDPNRAYDAPGLWGTLGIFRDASPDYWGRLVIEREAGVPELPEAEYLLRPNPTRTGALGFQIEREAEPVTEQPLGRLSLPRLLEASRRLEEDAPIDDRLLLLLRQGTSIGGARPKATLVEGRTYWLAKFPSRHDRMDMPAVEHATLKLAGEAGIRIPEVRLIDLADGRHVLLGRRFDREWAGDGGWRPFHYMSGLTLLGLHEAENARGAYPELADGLRRLSSDFPADAEELFRRMVFNILVSNDDDHLRNHALLRLPGGWRLSPAYDLVPHPQVGYERRQSINVGRYGRDGTLENALSKAARFGLTPERAARIIKNVETTVRPWRRRFAEWGVKEFDLERLQTAFLPESALQRY